MKSIPHSRALEVLPRDSFQQCVTVEMCQSLSPLSHAIGNSVCTAHTHRLPHHGQHRCDDHSCIDEQTELIRYHLQGIKVKPIQSI